jgi:hypothetical protein
MGLEISGVKGVGFPFCSFSASVEQTHACSDTAWRLKWGLFHKMKIVEANQKCLSKGIQ